MGADEPTDVPAALRTAFDAWDGAGRSAQPSARWSRLSWRSMFPEHAEWLETVPNPIARGEVTALAAGATTPEGALRAFIASMIWGYGPVGYGAWRTKRVLESNDDAGERLMEVAQVVHDRDGFAGFRDLADRPLKYLGVAFGTKYLYFLSLSSAAKRGEADGTSLAPVLDDVVRRWILANSGARVRIHSWNTGDYATYLALLDQWGAQLALPRGDVEELIFRSQVSQDDSRLWGEGWAAPTAEAEDAVGDASDALRQLRESLSSLPGDTNAVDEAAPNLAALAEIIERHRTR